MRSNFAACPCNKQPHILAKKKESTSKIHGTMLLPQPKSRLLFRATAADQARAGPALHHRPQSQREGRGRPRVAREALEPGEPPPALGAHGPTPGPPQEVLDGDDDGLQHEEGELAPALPRDRVRLPPVDAEADEEGEVELQVARGERALLQAEGAGEPDPGLLQRLCHREKVLAISFRSKVR